MKMLTSPIAITIALLYSIPASAQTSGSPQEATGADDSIGEIIVTAQKRSERLNDVPLSISALSGDQLAERGVTSVADLKNVVPGFTYRISSYGSPVFSLRGIGFYDEQIAIGPTVTTYVDQAPLPYSRMTEGAVLDVERVEVLKGPQGTLFGQNSTGGAINYIAAKPTDTFHAGFSGSYARFNNVTLEGYISGPISSTLNARLSAKTEQRDGWQVARTTVGNLTKPETLGETHFSAARLLLDWTPTDRLQVNFNFNGWKNTSDNQAGQARNATFPVVPYPAQTAAIQQVVNAYLAYNYYTGDNPRVADWTRGQSYRRDDRFYQGSMRVNYELSDNLSLVSITTYGNLKTFTPIDLDAIPVNGNTIVATGSIKSFSEELRLDGEMGPLKFVMGGNYQKDKTFEHQNFDFHGTNSAAAGVDINNAGINNGQKIRDLAVFGGVDFKVTPTVTVQASARYTDENRKFNGCLTGGDLSLGQNPYYIWWNTIFGITKPAGDVCMTILSGTFANPATVVTGEVVDSLNQTNFSWRGGINWKPNSDVMLYANVSKGYKAGGYGSLPALGAGALKPVVQESVLAYEIGAKATLLDRKLDINGALFYYDYKNKQLQGYVVDANFGNLPTLINIPESRVKGAEVNMTLRPVSGLTMNVGATYVNSKVTSLGSLPGVGTPFLQTRDITGESFPATPKWALQGDFDYKFPIGSVKAFIGSDFTYKSKSYSQFGSLLGPVGTEDLFLIKDHFLLGARLGVEIDDRYRVQIFGKNITNTHYWENVTHQYDTVQRYTGLPVTYGVSVSARF